MNKEEEKFYMKEYHNKYYKKNKIKIQKQTQEYKQKNKSHSVYMLQLPNNKMYIGSTNSFNVRLLRHKRDTILFSKHILYKSIIETGGWDSVKVHILMTNIPDELGMDFRRRLEQHFIDLIPKELRLNINNAVRRN